MAGYRFGKHASFGTNTLDGNEGVSPYVADDVNAMFAFGSGNIISGSSSNNNSMSSAFGILNTVTSDQAGFAVGSGNSVSVKSGIAMGLDNVAAGAAAGLALGSGNSTASTLVPGAVAIGRLNLASGLLHPVCIGYNNTASATDGGTSIGHDNTNSGDRSVALGSDHTITAQNGLCTGRSGTVSAAGGMAMGLSNVADNSYGMAIGYFADGKGRMGSIAHSSGRFATTGDSQCGSAVLAAETTDATIETMTMRTGIVATTAAFFLDTNTTLTFKCLIAARDDGAATAQEGGWEIKGVVGNNNGTTALVGAATVAAIGTSDFSSAVPSVDIDTTTNEALLIRVTGEAATNIGWVGRIEWAESIY